MMVIRPIERSDLPALMQPVKPAAG